MKFNIFYSWKFLIKNPILTTLTIICITLSSLILVASSNISNYVNEFQSQQITNIYGDYDISLEADYETEASFASLLGIQNLNDYYDDYVTGFKSIATLSKDASIDVDLLVTDTSSLNKLTNENYKYFGYGDIVVSKHLADELNLKLYDKIQISHYGFNTDVYVSDIVDNKNIFSNTSELNTVVISHYTMTSIFPIYNQYLFNFALFKTDNLELISKLEESYPLFITKDIKNDNMFLLIARSSELFAIAIAIPCLILCLLISYTISNYFEEHRNNELIKLRKIGVNEKNINIIKYIQSLLLSIISLLLVVLLVSILIPIVNNMYNINFRLELIEYFKVGLYILLVPFVIDLFIHLNNKNIITNKKIVIIASLLMLLLITLNLINKSFFSTINLFILYSFIFTLPYITYNVIKIILNKKNSILSILTKIEKCSLLPVLTISIIMTFSMTFYLNISYDTNVVLSTKDDITITGLTSNNNYKDVFNKFDATYIYEKNGLTLEDEFLNKMYSVDDLYTLKNSFGMDIQKMYSFESDEIIVSSYYNDVINYQIGDKVTLVINNISRELTISGFYLENIQYGNCIFINFETLSTFNISNYNKIIIHNYNDLNNINDILDNNNISARVYSGISASNNTFYTNVSLVNVISNFIILLILVEVLFVSILRYRNIKQEINVIKMVGCTNLKLILTDLFIFILKVLISLIISIVIVLLLKDVLYEVFLKQDVYLFLRISVTLSSFTNNLLISLITFGVLFIIVYFKKRKI